MRKVFVTSLFIVASYHGMPSFAQDSVDVTFRFNVPGFPSGLSVPGEFNGWNNTAWPMQYQGGTLWIRNARLRIGGNPNPQGIPGAWQYKFYYNGITVWPNDPLNHHVNSRDNDNSFLYVRDPTIYHFLPNQRMGTVTTDLPTISAYIFPKVGSVVDTAALSLTINGVAYTGIGAGYNFTTKQLTFMPPSPLPDGNHTAILRVGQSADTVNFIVQVSGPPVLAMPSYAKHGVTLPSQASSDSTSFRLRVGSGHIILRIAPLGQPVASAEPMFMRKNPSSDDWWINLMLSPGTYEYQYQTDNGTMINDPWGRFNGTYGSRFTIGPEGLTADDYVWQSTNYQRPPLNKIVLYELHVGEFAGGFYGLTGGQAGFSHLTTLLPYLDSLGINAIELMPINDYGIVGRSGHSWGYESNSLFALEPAYGTPRDFKVFVDSAHARGIAVIVDVVFNHLNDTGPLWQMRPNEATNPYFKLCSDRRFNEDDLCWFRDMDHWTPETQELIYEVLKMWIDEYRVDGFRYDYTQGIGWNISDPTKGILGWANRIHQDYGGTIYQIAEHLPESPALLFHSGLTSGWHDSFHDEVFDEARFRNRSLTNIENLVLDLGAYPGNDFPSTPSVYANRTGPVNATVTHDEQSLIYEMTTFQSVSLAEALVRDRLYGALMFTSLGIPMLWQGMEFSAPRGWMNEGQKLSYRPVEWNLYPTARGQLHYHHYRSLIRQRRYNPALFNGVLRKLWRYNSEKTLVWGLEDSTSGAKFMAVANFSGSQQTVNNVPWLGSGTWYDIFDQSTITVSGSTVPSMVIPAYTGKFFSNVSDSVLLDVGRTEGEVPKKFELAQNFPNPFNPSTTIRFNIPHSGHVSLKVYDILGREIETLAEKAMIPGSYSVTWQRRDGTGRQVSSGVYFYKLVVIGDDGTTSVATKRMILLR